MTTVVFLPFAGAGASVFRPWTEHARDRFSILAVQLPGREERFGEEPLGSVAAAVDYAFEQVRQAVPATEEVALFGHCLGAVLAFELALRIEGGGTHKLARLFVSGSPGPWNSRAERASELDDDAFLAQVRRFAGYDHPALAVPELRKLLLPALRADVLMQENYAPPDRRRIAAPVTSLRGTRDELVDRAQAAQWAEVTDADLTAREIEGGHMYLTEAVLALLDIIAVDLGQAVAR
jgi:surfactin synthase thioesterase subunit